MQGTYKISVNPSVCCFCFVLLAIGLYAADQVDKPDFDIPRGFYSSEQQVTISTKTDGAVIRYTLDCSTPSEEYGIIYTSPIPVSKTTIIRAIAYKDNMNDSEVTTHTYIFPADVLKQAAAPSGFPGLWGEVPAKYDMNASYPETDATILAALQSLPTVSIVTDPDDMFGSEGIYLNGGRDDNAQWEKPGSIELLYADPGRNFQENTGIQPRNQPVDKTRKRGFRMDFKTIYGAGRLEKPIFDDAIELAESAVKQFDSIILRSGYMENYTGREFNPAYMIYIRDPMVRDAQLAVSGYGTHNLFVQAYVNGLYWGILNLTEAVDTDFLMDYFGGDESQWTIIKSNAKSNDNGQLVSGNSSWYLQLLELVETSDISDPGQYEKVATLIDPVYFADYIILQNYFAVGDWPNNNWIFAMRCYPDVQPGRFYCWDDEKCWLENDDPQSYKHARYTPYLWSDETEELLLQGYSTVPSRIWRALIKNVDFRMLFADRIYRHLFNNGPLTNSNNLKRLQTITDYIDPAFPADQMRWSNDDTRDINPGVVYDRTDWQAEVDRVHANVEMNVEYFISDFRIHNLYPVVDPPVFNTESGHFETGFILEITNPNAQTGTIYYTNNGPDPREPGGSVSESAINGDDRIDLSITGTTSVKARIKYNDEWSAVHQVTLIGSQSLSALKITELMYRPADFRGIDGDEFEFLELKNTGSRTVNLSQVSLSDGIDYRFSDGVVLDGQQFIVLAKNSEMFQSKYGIQPFDQYSGNLDNNGERVSISDPDNHIIFSVHYHDNTPWPSSANGAGYSLVPVSYNTNPLPDDPQNWRASLFIHGSPGEDDSSRFDLPEPSLFTSNSKILFVVRDKKFDESPDDMAVFTHLDASGSDLTVMSENEVNEAAAIGRDIILISRSVAAGNIKDQFRNVPIPVLLWEPSLFDNMGMTGDTDDLDYGEINEGQIEMSGSEHPAAGGFTGVVRVNYDESNDMTWGKPNENAVIIARWPSDESKASIFLYEKGSTMFSLTAPARRIGFFMNEGIASDQTVAGWQLFDASLKWALYAPEDTTAPPMKPSTYLLQQNYPNPFNTITRIDYRLQHSARVILEIFSITGQKVKTLINGEQEAGFYHVIWDGTKEPGVKVASGLYIIRMRTKDPYKVYSQAKKMLYIK